MGIATDEARQTSVFIAGGGPVGLAMSLLLDRFGIDCVVVEKSPTTTDHPKSRGCWVRTMEIFRQWGIEQAIRDRGLQDNSDMFVFLDSIAGHEFGRTRPEPNVGHTPRLEESGRPGRRRGGNPAGGRKVQTRHGPVQHGL
ncbi:FAD-dependent monooxygenase [Bradyrhizobium elkanii]|uniref:FAD-dependent monooxygenase n=1 Tax=Bradyrhizobium elkanii TaxID=29448 RepID=UPI0038372552